MTAAEHDSIEKRLRRALNDRSLEWFLSLLMLGWGVTLAQKGDLLAQPAYAAFARYGVTEAGWAFIFCTISGARMAALYINGRQPKTPYLRMLGALFGAITWAQLSWLVTDGNLFRTGVLTPGSVTYGLFALAEILSIFRAAFDARYYNS